MRISRVHRIIAAVVVTTVLGSTAVAFTRGDSSEGLTALPVTKDSAPLVTGAVPATGDSGVADEPATDEPTTSPSDEPTTSPDADAPKSTVDAKTAPRSSSDSATGSKALPVAGPGPTTSPDTGTAPIADPEPTASPQPSPAPAPSPTPSPTPTRRTLLDALLGR